MKHMTSLRACAYAGAVALLATGGVAAATSAAAKTAPARATIAGTHPSWATSAALVSSSAVTSGTVTARVYLAPRTWDGLTLAQFAQQVSTPGSSRYGDYLSAAAALADFAPDKGEADSVASWFAAGGLKTSEVYGSAASYVQVTGSASAVAKAFDVTFHTYKHGSQHVRAPQSDASVPTSVAADILTVSGLDSATHFDKPGDTLPPPSQNFFVAPDDSAYYGQLPATVVPGTTTKIPTAYGKVQSWTTGGYTPAQIRGAYNAGQPGQTGKGVTVAVVDAYASPTMLTDADQYASYVATHGGNPALDRPFRPGQFNQVLLGDTDGWTDTAANECDAPGWYEEETLDVESVHGVAPDANVTYVGAVSCNDTDLLAAEAYIVDHHTASIVTDSWGEPYDDSDTQPAYDQVFELGAAEGIGFFFSSGDSGYEDPTFEDPGVSDKLQVDFPTSSPWVTSVGGTSLAIGKNDNYEFETSWGTELDPLAAGGGSWQFNPPGTPAQEEANYDGSGGGGVSTAYPQPFYQAGVVPRSLALNVPEGTTRTPMRVVPDVAALADPSTGILVGETLFGADNTTEQFFLSRIGGTSLASPVFAGVEADAQQALGRPIGFANPVIYGLAALNSSDHAFNDVSDHPAGQPFHLAQVRSDYTDPFTKTLPLVTNLRTLGINGIGASALPAVQGYDDATGVGSPRDYIQDLRSLVPFRR